MITNIYKNKEFLNSQYVQIDVGTNLPRNLIQLIQSYSQCFFIQHVPKVQSQVIKETSHSTNSELSTSQPNQSAQQQSSPTIVGWLSYNSRTEFFIPKSTFTIFVDDAVFLKTEAVRDVVYYSHSNSLIFWTHEVIYAYQIGKELQTFERADSFENRNGFMVYAWNERHDLLVHCSSGVDPSLTSSSDNRPCIDFAMAIPKTENGFEKFHTFPDPSHAVACHPSETSLYVLSKYLDEQGCHSLRCDQYALPDLSMKCTLPFGAISHDSRVTMVVNDDVLMVAISNPEMKSVNFYLLDPFTCQTLTMFTAALLNFEEFTSPQLRFTQSGFVLRPLGCRTIYSVVNDHDVEITFK